MEELTEEEKGVLWNYLAQSQSMPQPDEKFNVHTFLHRIATADDTTKVGFLNEDEIGNALHPIRGHKEFALISSGIIGNKYFSDYFKTEGEIITSTSLSRQGFLVKQGTTTVRKIGDISQVKTPNKSWFKRKEKEPTPQE